MVYAVIRMKGMFNVRYDLDKTLKLLKLNKKYHCVIVPATKENAGMLSKVHKMVTWGDINEETLKFLLIKRGRVAQNARLSEEFLKKATGKDLKTILKALMEEKMKLKEIPGIKTVFRLRPPAKGYESRSVKKEFSMGGMVGYRGDAINELLKRMI